MPRLEHSSSDIIKTTMVLNGWSNEALAWGLVLRHFVMMGGDLEIVIEDGTHTTVHTLEER
jgi:hypothetical protein